MTTSIAPTDSPAAACCGPDETEGATTRGTSAGPTDVEHLARTFKALGDPTRVRLLAIVAASTGGEACVCDLVEPVGLSQPTVSHHLKILVDAGLLRREKRGVWAYYALVPSAGEGAARDLLGITAPRGPSVT